MQRYRLPLTREVPIPSNEEAQLPQPIAYYYLASEVDARIAELERELSVARDEITDLRAFIGTVRNHVYYAAKAYGLTS